MKQDQFEHPDFYQLDALLSEEQKLIRSSIRDFVKKEISPYIEDWAFISTIFHQVLHQEVGQTG